MPSEIFDFKSIDVALYHATIFFFAIISSLFKTSPSTTGPLYLLGNLAWL